MTKDLTGKVAVVTGAGRVQGIGAGIARGLAAAGAKVVISDVSVADQHMPQDKIGNQGEIEQILSEIMAAGGVATALPCDVRDEDQVQKLMQGAVDQFGSLDVLINNAGIGYIMKPMVDVSKDEWQTVLDVNLMGSFLCTKHAVKKMISQGNGGRIINIASQGAKSGFPHLPAYIASKHGMIGLTRSNAVELGPEKITVNAICPNHITTDLGAEQNEYFAKFMGKSVEQYLSDMASRIPMGRPGLVTDIANAAVFLSSDDSYYITGEAMNVSGGEEMH